MNSIESGLSASSHTTGTSIPQWEFALIKLEIELEIKSKERIAMEKIASKERIKMKELELKYGQTPTSSSGSNDSVFFSQYFQNKVKENVINDHLEVPSWLLTENDIPYHRLSEFHISTERMFKIVL